MRIDVAFTPAARPAGPPPAVALVVDVLRATTTIGYAVAAGAREVLACRDLEQARQVAAAIGPDAVLAGERGCVKPDGFDLGNSPRQFGDGAVAGRRLVLTTTNGTGALVAATVGGAGTVLVASLANLGRCAERAAAIAAADGGEVLVQCAGVLGEFTIDDAYAAGRYVDDLRGRLPDWAVTDAAAAASRLAAGFPSPLDGLAASQSARNLHAAGLDEDVAFCAREGALAVVPAVAGVEDGVARVAA